MNEANLRVALELAAAGIPIFPALISRNEESKKLNKKPAIAEWRANATTDANQVKAWWQQFPDAVPAIELGRAGLVVLDLDRHPGAPDGVKAFLEMRKRIGATWDGKPMPTTLTPSGGYHVIFCQPSNCEPFGNSRGDLPLGCDVRGAGGWIVAPGAVCPWGTWQPKKGAPSPATAYKTAAIIVLPEWLQKILRPQRAAPEPPRDRSHSAGRREESYAAKALDNLARELAAMAPETGRNERLNIAALKLGTMVAAGWIGEATAKGRLFDACVANSLVEDTGDDAMRATIRSGFQAGLKEPHPDLKERDRPKGNGAASSTDQKAIDALAQLDGLAYQKQRLQEAKGLGITVDALDKLVRQARARIEEDHAVLPHWKVEPASEPVEGTALLDDIKQVFKQYIVLPKGADIALALWVLHAWTMDAGDISPFMVLTSPTKRCGKTNVLILLYYLTPRSELSSNITPSALFRYIEEARPTLLIDEADSFVKDNEELRGILNSGHTKTAAHVIRNIEINGEHKPRRFSTWAPKAIATIRSLADTLEDRAVVLKLQRKPRTAAVERLRKRDSDEFASLRRRAARWAVDNFDKLADPDPKVPDELNDRAADNWRPLLAIAELAGEDWPKRAREAACVLSGEGHDAASVNVELLADIRKAFGDLDAITSAELVAALVADPERPWATWGMGDKPLTQNQLARLLKPFGVISETVHPIGRPDAKGYKRVHFEEVWAGYLSGQNPSPPPTGAFKASNRPNADEMGTTRDFSSVQKSAADGSKNANLSYSHAGLDAWTDGKPKSGGGSDSATDNTTVNGQPETAKAPSPAPEVCTQCGAADPGPLLHAQVVEGVVRLHRECVRFWLKAHPQPLGRAIPLVQIIEIPATGTLQ